MYIYQVKKKFFASSIKTWIPVGAHICRFEKVAKLVIHDNPQSDPLITLIDGIQYGDPNEISWIYAVEPPPLGTNTTFMTIVSHVDEDECGNVGGGGGGETGTQGADGVQGAQGTANVGLQGSQGEDGLQGFQGDNGLQGPLSEGPQGPEGSQGLPGGVQGFQGLVGTGGAQGDVGTDGSQGLVGDTGSQGLVGTDGAQGTAGNDGVQGEVGFQGVAGAAGSAGAEGTQGAVGTDGSTGAAGAQGVLGLQGVAGLQGIQGATGTQGDIGLIAGISFLGTVVSNDSVTITGGSFDITTNDSPARYAAEKKTITTDTLSGSIGNTTYVIAEAKEDGVGGWSASFITTDNVAAYQASVSQGMLWVVIGTIAANPVSPAIWTQFWVGDIYKTEVQAGPSFWTTLGETTAYLGLGSVTVADATSTIGGQAYPLNANTKVWAEISIAFGADSSAASISLDNGAAFVPWVVTDGVGFVRRILLGEVLNDEWYQYHVGDISLAGIHTPGYSSNIIGANEWQGHFLMADSQETNSAGFGFSGATGAIPSYSSSFYEGQIWEHNIQGGSVYDSEAKSQVMWGGLLGSVKGNNLIYADADGDIEWDFDNKRFTFPRSSYENTFDSGLCSTGTFETGVADGVLASITGLNSDWSASLISSVSLTGGATGCVLAVQAGSLSITVKEGFVDEVDFQTTGGPEELDLVGCVLKASTQLTVVTAAQLDGSNNLQIKTRQINAFSVGTESSFTTVSGWSVTACP